MARFKSEPNSRLTFSVGGEAAELDFDANGYADVDDEATVAQLRGLVPITDGFDEVEETTRRARAAAAPAAEDAKGE